MNKPNEGHDGTEHKQPQAALERRFKGLLEGLESLQNDLNDLREAHAKIGVGQAWLDEQQTLIKERYVVLEDRQRTLEERQAGVEGRQARVEERQMVWEEVSREKIEIVAGAGKPMQGKPSEQSQTFNYLLSSYVPFNGEPIRVVEPD